MQIVGEWLLCDDGASGPAILVQVAGDSGRTFSEHFLVDTMANNSVFSAFLLNRLNLATQPAPSGLSLQGISGASPFVVVATRLDLPRADGGPATIRGTFAAFTDPAATDLSILGRDVLDQFDVIVSRRRNQVLLLAGNHQYQLL